MTTNNIFKITLKRTVGIESMTYCSFSGEYISMSHIWVARRASLFRYGQRVSNTSYRWLKVKKKKLICLWEIPTTLVPKRQVPSYLRSYLYRVRSNWHKKGNILGTEFKFSFLSKASISTFRFLVNLQVLFPVPLCIPTRISIETCRGISLSGRERYVNGPPRWLVIDLWSYGLCFIFFLHFLVAKKSLSYIFCESCVL